MGQQLTLPARWAATLFSSTDPQELLDEAAHGRREAKGDIRAVLDKYAAKYRFKLREIGRAMDHTEDMLSDLFYEAEEGCRGEVEARLHP